jgi:transcriptional regulator with PAS, ATPase and Fis domain
MTGDAGMGELVKSIALKQESLDVVVKIVNPLDFQECETTAQELAEFCDAIITQSGIKEQISQKVQIQIIEFFYSIADVLDALYKASKIGRKAVLLFHRNIEYDLGDWPAILNITVRTVTYAAKQDVLKTVVEAQEEDAVVIGPTMAVGYAQQLGVPSCLITPSKTTLRKSLTEAVEIVLATTKEKERSARLKAVLDSINEGVMFLTDDLKIDYVNNSATEILRKEESDLIGRDVREVNKHDDDAVWNDLQTTPVLGHIFQVENSSVIGNVTPITVNQERKGVIFTYFEASRLQSVEHDLRRKLSGKKNFAKFNLKDIIGKSEAITQVKQQAEIFARADSTVVIIGESGVGKELFAQSIHNLSKRSDKPFVPLNCSALPKELIESELFGYEEGAFTGARKGGKTGMFELAHGGTIFLDEITTMPLELQSKMLRVIQEKEVTRLGGTTLIPVNVRIIVASNVSLSEAVRRGDFREDLYYRLNVLQLKVIPLRERVEDIPLLFEYFMKRYQKQYDREIQTASLKNVSLLQNYHWRGNVRELMNFCERFVIMSENNPDLNGLLKECLNQTMSEFYSPEDLQLPAEGTWKDMWKEMEKDTLKQYITEQGISKTALAKKLGISRTALWKKLHEEEGK